jgi:hypothetical protein
MRYKYWTLLIAVFLAFSSACVADTFGLGANTFTIDFVAVGNPGNSDDSSSGGGLYFSPFGRTDYEFRISTYEISAEQVVKAGDSGLANVTTGPFTGSRSAVNISWYEAAAFVNWLNVTAGHQPAYNLTLPGGNWSFSLWNSSDAWQLGGENRYRHKDAYYFPPSEDEWYKSAYHRNDGSTGSYWDYATGSDSIPDGIDSSDDTQFEAVFFQGFNQNQPNAVTAAGSSGSPYGTRGQAGNVREWMESAWDEINDSTLEGRAVRGGAWYSAEVDLRSSSRAALPPGTGDYAVGFRVASIPEPSPFALILVAIAPFGLFVN